MKKNKISASLEDYLETIFEIIREKKSVKAIEISRRLGVGRSSVTEALQNLADKKLVNYRRYDVISLTSTGEEAARKIRLKHQVLFEFLANTLGIDEKEAHKNACRIEHVISDEVFNKIALFNKFNKESQQDNIDYIEEFREFSQKTISIAKI